MDAHVFDCKKQIFITGFQTTFKFVCETIWFDERAAMWVLPHYVHETLAMPPNNRMYAENRTTLIIAAVYIKGTKMRELLQFHPQVVDVLLKSMPRIKPFQSMV